MNNPSQTVKICGAAAIRAVWEKRPAAIKHLVFTEKLAKEFGDICSALAAQRRSYAQQTAQELRELCGHGDHAGVIALCTPLGLPTFKPKDIDAIHRGQKPILIIDALENPATLASLVRTAVAIGLGHIVFKQAGCNQVFNHDETWRLAQGAMEAVQFYYVSSLHGLIKAIRPQFLTIGGLPTGRGGRNLDWAKRPSAPGRPFALVLSESSDSWDKLAPHCETPLQLPQLAAGKDLPTEVLGGLLMSWLRPLKP